MRLWLILAVATLTALLRDVPDRVTLPRLSRSCCESPICLYSKRNSDPMDSMVGTEDANLDVRLRKKSERGKGLGDES